MPDSVRAGVAAAALATPRDGGRISDAVVGRIDRAADAPVGRGASNDPAAESFGFGGGSGYARLP